MEEWILKKEKTTTKKKRLLHIDRCLKIDDGGAARTSVGRKRERVDVGDEMVASM